jgi:integrase/recombinase XerD
MAKYTVKLLLWEHDTNSKNKHPIYIQVTINRLPRYIATGYHIKKTEWDARNEQVKSSNSLADTINADIQDRKQKIVKFIVEANLRSEIISSAIVKEKFSGGRDLHNYFEFTESFAKEVRSKRKKGTRDNYTKHAKKLELFHGSKQLSFEDITPAYLTRYEQALIDEELNPNYVHKLLTGIRTMFNAAIKRGIISSGPFQKFEMPQYHAPDKDYLTLKELDAIEKLVDETTDEVLKQSALYLLLGCYTGLRISDWFKFDVKKNVKEWPGLLARNKK